MSRSGTKTITLDEEDHEPIKEVAKRNGLSIKDAVLFAMKKTFPNDFPEKTIA
jgi:hypothetical protein